MKKIFYSILAFLMFFGMAFAQEAMQTLVYRRHRLHNERETRLWPGMWPPRTPCATRWSRSRSGDQLQHHSGERHGGGG